MRFAAQVHSALTRTAHRNSANGTKDFRLPGMNAKRAQPICTLCSIVGLLSSVIAACSGAGPGGLVTVGIRPTGELAASSGSATGGSGGLALPGSDVMTQIPADNTTSEVAGAGASGASAGASAGAAAGPSSEDAGSAGAAVVAGAGGVGAGAAGMGGSAAADRDECGAVSTQAPGNVMAGRLSGSGLIEYDASAPNVFTGLRTTLTVPAEPPPNGQIFIWPGIQPTPTAANFQTIGNGALLSVLTWGPSACATDLPASYSTWWMAPTYSNISASDSRYAGCHIGKVVRAEPTQRLDIDIHLEGTTWVQKVVSRDTLQTSEFSMDLNGQAQGRVFFDIELQTSNKPTEDIVFTHTVLSLETSDPDACQPVLRGTNDFASKPRVSADGKHCCIDRIVLRARGVMATTMDPP